MPGGGVRVFETSATSLDKGFVTEFYISTEELFPLSLKKVTLD